MKEIKQSETVIINRSEINLNPINPKKHTDEKVKIQKKNLQKVGFLGGIVWNRITGNLIDGHRRIKAMDLHYKYDGTPETDYQVKVEAVELDDKAEKEQLTYMAVGNTKYDIDLIADYIHEIDYTDIGLSDDEMNSILSFADTVEPQVETMDELIAPPVEKTPEDKKAHVKDIKQQVQSAAMERVNNENAYITLSFSTFEAKTAFCELIGADVNGRFIKGESVLTMIE